MTRDEAKLILDLFRPDQDDPADPVFAEAFSLLQSDTELAAWFEAGKLFDKELRAAARSIEPPPGLRESLLAGSKVIRPSFFPGGPWLAPALAIAAALAALLAIASLMQPSAGVIKDPVLAAIALKIPALTDLHHHSKSSSGNMEVIRSWLAENGGVSGFRIPKGLEDAAGVACEIAEIEGHKVTILCFELGGDRTAHLYVVSNPSSETGEVPKPAFFERDGVAVASWQVGGLSYFLAERCPMESVRRLL